ncbi:MAG: rod shape-determining protein MreD [Clostridia bacterium]|nr:rod shape-determining protein MreD [Clostridia bacterium]
MNQMFQNKAVFKFLLTAILIFVLTILQTTVIQGIEVFHVIPNLLLITVVCYSLLHGDYSALVVGVVCGFLLDINGGRVVGMNALLCTVLAYVCICVSGSLYSNNGLIAMIFVLIFSLFYELIVYIFYFAIWGQGAFFYALFCKILPAAVYNGLATILLYPLVRRLTVFNQ